MTGERKNENGYIVLYEVYSKRALHEPIETLVLYDRDTNNREAIDSAIQWGGVVMKVEAVILSREPMTRRVISSEVYWIHTPTRPKEQGERQTIPKIKSKLHKKHFKSWQPKK